MATFNKFNSASLYMVQGFFRFGTDTFKTYLSNGAPNAATHTVKATGPAEVNGNGATVGGETLAITTAAVSGTTAKATVTSDITITATGPLGPFQYIPLYDDTQTSPADPLFCWWDYGSPVSLAATETFTEDFDQAAGLWSVT